MAFGSFDSDGSKARPMAEINMIPLIDVMLVLLVIFIITAPLLTHAVKLDLPKAASTPNLTKPDNIQLAIDGASRLYWNGEVVDRAGLRARLAAAGKLEPQPEVHLRADKTTPYEAVAQVLADAAKAGLTRIGFLSDPNEATQ
jgi:biopolymer transport protein ExbD